MLGEDILFLPVAELAQRIKSGKLSPVELTQSYLERSRTIGPRLNAYVTLTEKLALDQAHAAEKEIAAGKYRGPLHGIPYAAKDLLAVKGYPTTWGARPYANQQFDYDATVIRKLTDAGAVLIGKAAMIELAGGMGYRYASAAATGAAKNPWNTNCWTCGSSSGSGAIMAAGLAAFALGTETFHHLPFRLYWHHGIASYFWTRKPLWRHGAGLFHGQDWSHLPHRWRLRSGAADHLGPRSAGPRFVAGRPGPLHRRRTKQRTPASGLDDQPMEEG